MGQQARMRARRRAELAAHSERIRALVEDTEADPEFQAAEAAAVADTAAVALALAAVPAQSRRLTAAGFRQAAGDTAGGAGVWDHRRGVRIIHSAHREADGKVWGHVSVSARDHTLPGWYEVRDCQRLLYPGDAGLIVVPPVSEHVDIAEVAHVWTCLEGPVTPDFRRHGQI